MAVDLVLCDTLKIRAAGKYHRDSPALKKAGNVSVNISGFSNLSLIHIY